MKYAPCERLTMRMRPKISENPDARMNRRDPNARPFKPWMIQKFMRDPSRQCELFRRRPVARIDWVLEEFVRAVCPELAHRWIGLDDRILQSSVLFLHLADRDIEDRLTVRIELHRTIGTL